MNPRLVGIAGPLKGTTFVVPEGMVSIGRESANHLWITDPALSRKHCELLRNGDLFTIRDLQSHNGTLVNGMPVTEEQLRHMDQISVGDSVLVFLLHEVEIDQRRSSVQMTETVEPGRDPLLLREEDALYLHPEGILAVLPQTARMTRDLNSILKIAIGIGTIRDRESLEWQLLGMIFDVVPAERAAILSFDGSADEFSSSVAWDRLQGPGHPVRVSRTVVRRVFQERVGLMVSDVKADETWEMVKSLDELKTRSLLCVPLIVAGSVKGVIYLDSQNPAETFDENHLQVMTAVASLAALALDNVRAFQELQDENQLLRSEIDLEHNMVGGSPGMRQIYERIRRVAPTDSTVLILGESGTGKELAARAVHGNSTRSDRPFVAINCAAITETLLESELFGHEKGAFTGAVAQKKGKIELAEGGTLFLDEISEMAPGLQAKLLRVLQEREFERVGGTRAHKVDIRVIAATNRNLQDAIKAGTFRADLYHRLNVVALNMPPLRDRKEDILALAEHFIGKISKKCGMHRKTLSAGAQAWLLSYEWPGNVRELENAIERALVLGAADTVLAEDLPETLLESPAPAADQDAKYYGAVKDNKRRVILQALDQAKGNYIEAAKSLGLHPNSLLRLIRNLGLKAEKEKRSAS
jgi:transcriptional regulator with GAF, ATPase, and Fis domain